MLRPHLSWFWKVCLGTHLNMNGCMYSYRSSLQKIPNVPFPIVVAGGERFWTCEGTGVVQGSHKLVCHRKRKLTWREEKKLRKGWSGSAWGEGMDVREAVVAYCLLRAMLVQTYFKFHEHWQGLEVVQEMILSVPILPLRNSNSKQWFFHCLLSRKISKWEVTSLAFKLNKYQTVWKS